MMLLKCLADAGEVAVAIEHMKRVGEMWPRMLNEFRVELLSWLTSWSKPQPILELIQAIENDTLPK